MKLSRKKEVIIYIPTYKANFSTETSSQYQMRENFSNTWKNNCWYLSHADVDPGFHSQCTRRQETNVGRCSIQSIEPGTAIPTHPMSKGLGFSQRKVICAALDIHVFRNKLVNWQSFWFPNARDKSWRPTHEKKKYTKLVWWTWVRTWSSAKNALVAWRVIFLMASFCNHKTRRESS